MSEMRVGEKAVIKEIPPDLCTIISSMGLRRNQAIELRAIQPAKGPFVVAAGNIDVSVSRAYAEKITVGV